MPKTRSQTKKDNEEVYPSNNKSNYGKDDKKNKYGKRKWDVYINEDENKDFNIDLKKLKNDKNINLNEKILEKLNVPEGSLPNKVNNINIISNLNITDYTKNLNNLNDYKNDIKLNSKVENLNDVKYQNDENKYKYKKKYKQSDYDDEDENEYDLNNDKYKDINNYKNSKNNIYKSGINLNKSNIYDFNNNNPNSQKINNKSKRDGKKEIVKPNNIRNVPKEKGGSCFTILFIIILFLSIIFYVGYQRIKIMKINKMEILQNFKFCLKKLKIVFTKIINIIIVIFNKLKEKYLKKK